MNIFQIKVGMMDNFSYVLIDNKEAAIIDPSFDFTEQIKIIDKHKATLKYIILTHNHFDHTHSVKELKKQTDAKIIMHELEEGNKDIAVKDETILKLGNINLSFIHTPGHTKGGMCILVENNIFTGDTLFIGAIGRTDLPRSDSSDMEKSLKKLSQLDDNIKVYPGHDYADKGTSTIGDEKKSGFLFK